MSRTEYVQHVIASFAFAIRKKWKFLLLYSAVVLAGCFLAAVLTPRVTYNDYRLGSDLNREAGTVGLRDGQRIVMTLTLPADNVTGFYLDGFDTNGLVLTDETLEVSVYALSGEKICGETFNLHDMAARATESSGGKLYVMFPQTASKAKQPDQAAGMSDETAVLKKGTPLVIRMRTHGLNSRGILFAMSNRKGSAFADCRLFLKGKAQNWILAGGVWEAVPAGGWYTDIVLGGEAFLLLGLILAAISMRWNLPDVIRRRAGSREQEKNNAVDEKIAVVCLFICLLLIIWGYLSGIRDAAERVEPVASAISSDADQTEWSALPGERQALRQEFTVEESGFSGIGLSLRGMEHASQGNKAGISSEENDVDGHHTKENDIVLTARISDMQGNLLAEEQYSVRNLRPLIGIINQTDGSLTDAIGNYYYFPFANVQLMEGQQYVVTIFAESNEKSAVRINVLSEQQGGGPQLITLYRNHRHLPAWYWGITLGLLAILTASIAGRLLHKGAGARFLILFLILGTAFSLSIPFYGAPDEKAHINTVYSLSNRLSGIPAEIGPDCVLQSEEDAEILTRVDSVGFTAQHPVLLDELFRKDEAEKYEPVFYQNTMNNTTVFNYLPAVLGFSLGRVMGMNLATRILLARWSNLLVCALMIFAGIRKSPVGKHAMMAVALFPMLLQMAASCSYDAVIIGSAFLFIGYVFHILMAESGRDVSLADLVMLTFSGGLFLSSKQGVYLPVLCLLLLMPVFHRGEVYKKAVRIAVIAGIVCLAVGFLPGFIRNFLSPESTYVERYYTLHEVVLHPGKLFRILGNTIVSETGDLIAGTVADGLASLYVRIPTWLILILCLIAVMSMGKDAAESVWKRNFEQAVNHKSHYSTGNKAVYSKEDIKTVDTDKKPQGINAGRRGVGWWILLIILVGILFLNFAALFGMTPKGSSQITGLQGRYFLPYAVLIGLLPSFGFAGCRGQRGRSRGRSVRGNLSRPVTFAREDREKLSLMEGMGKRISNTGILLLFMGCADLAVLVFVFVQLYG